MEVQPTHGTNSSGDVIFEMATPFDIPYIRVLMITSYSLVSALCIIGNALVIFVIARKMRSSSTTYFLANLAVSDLCVGIFCVMPTLLQNISPDWVLGRVMCKLHYFVQSLSYTASITFLTLVSLERYLAIIHPMLSRRLSRKTLLRGVTLIAWLTSASYGIPIVVFYDTVSVPEAEVTKAYCVCKRQLNMEVYVIVNFALWYLLPLSLMSVVYVRISVALWKSSRVKKISIPLVPLNITRHSQGVSTGDGHPRETNSNNEDRHARHENTDPFVTDTCLLSTSPRTASVRSFPVRVSSRGMVPTSDTASRNHSRVARCKSLPATFKERRHTSSRAGIPGAGHGNVFTHRGSVIVSKSRKDADRAEGLRLNYYKKVKGGAGVGINRHPLIMRRKVIRLLIVIIVAFAICVLPLHVRLLWQTLTDSQSYSLSHLLVPPLTYLVFYFNSCLNPFLYALLSRNFRKHLARMCRCDCPSVRDTCMSRDYSET